MTDEEKRYIASAVAKWAVENIDFFDVSYFLQPMLIDVTYDELRELHDMAREAMVIVN